ncbi:MAG: Uma2 family endonuclease [Acidobacteriota bacterium]
MPDMATDVSKDLCICYNCLHSRLTSHCEILNGEMKDVPLPDIRHQRVRTKLTTLLLQYTEKSGLGTVVGAPCNVMLTPWDIVRPDILYIRKNRTGIMGEQIILGSPDLVVEILSNETQQRDLKEKRKLYAESGIAEYWIADPVAESIETLIWSELGYISAGVTGTGNFLSSVLLPNLNFSLSNIFETF